MVREDCVKVSDVLQGLFCFFRRDCSVVYIMWLLENSFPAGFDLFHTFISGVKTEGTTVTLHLETDDVEAAVAKSVTAGAVKVGDVSKVETDGAVMGKVTDPFGVTWIFSSPAKKTEDDENKEV